MQLAEQVRREQESRREIQEEVRNWERAGARLHGQVQDVHLQLQRRMQELKNTKDELQQYRDQTEVREPKDLVSSIIKIIYYYMIISLCISKQYVQSYMSLMTSSWCHGSFIFLSLLFSFCSVLVKLFLNS